MKRLQRILFKLAQDRAPHLRNGWDHQADPVPQLQKLARNLASHNLFVFTGLPPKKGNPEEAVQRWINAYEAMYNLLAQRLFKPYTGLKIMDADHQMPPIIAFDGQATPVITVLAGFISPYMAVRQLNRQHITEFELYGFMDFILRELEAHDLPDNEYDVIHEGGSAVLYQLLHSRVEHVLLTNFDRPILRTNGFQDDNRQNQTMPTISPNAAPPPPQELPEQSKAHNMMPLQLDELPEPDEHVATQEMFQTRRRVILPNTTTSSEVNRSRFIPPRGRRRKDET